MEERPKDAFWSEDFWVVIIGSSMKKILFAFTTMFILVALGTFLLAWYAGYKWENGGVYNIPNDDSLVRSIQNNAFSRTFTCLSYLSGNLYHGQDRFEIVKFKLNVDEASWSFLSNVIYTANSYVSSYATPIMRKPVGTLAILDDLAEKQELLLDMRCKNGVCLYMTFIENSGVRFLYLKGRLIPTSRVKQVINVQD